MQIARRARLGLFLVVGCGPTPGTTGGDTGSSESSGTPGGSSSTTVSSTGETPPTTGGVTTSGTTVGDTTAESGTTSGTTTDAPMTTGTDTSTDTGSTTGEVLCGEPDAEGVVASWTINVDGDPPPDSITAACAVAASEVVGLDWIIDLDCSIDGQDRLVELVVTREPMGEPTLQLDEQVTLEYRAEPIFWINEWFAIHPPQAPSFMAVSGIQADHAVPDGTTAAEFFGVDMAVLDGVCEPFADEPCGPTIRLGLDMAWSAASQVFFDGQHGGLFDLGGNIQVWVANATRPLDDSMCEDVPPAWFRVVMSGSYGP